MIFSRLQLFKSLVLLVSSVIFVIQVNASLNKLLYPQLADISEVKSIDDIKPPLITICPFHQINETKAKEFGYSGEPLDGIQEKANGSVVVTWGAHLNKTFDQLLEAILNPEIRFSVDGGISGVFNEKNMYTNMLKKKFYVGFWGFCWNLENYNLSHILNIYPENKSTEKYSVYVTENHMKTFYSINLKHQKGLNIQSNPSRRHWYEVSLKKYSIYDPRSPDKCAFYESNTFENCVDDEIQSLVLPDIGCNPPWMSSQNICNATKHLTNLTKESYQSKLSPFLYNNYNSIEDLCPKSCEVTAVTSRLKFYYSDFPNMIKLSFAKDVPFNSKYLTYNISSFIIDIGNCKIYSFY